MHRSDFDDVLAMPPRVRSVHFAVHHVSSASRPASPRQQAAVEEKLSTDLEHVVTQIVDNKATTCRAGFVVPKRFARRAVTRNLLRRQMRAALDRHAGALPAGRLVLRLRAPFAPDRFVSAASDALRQAAREELDALMRRLAEGGSGGRPARGGSRPERG